MNRNVAHQSIAVVGYGITGQACVRFLLSQQAKVCVIDRNVNIQQILANNSQYEHVDSAIFAPDMSLSQFTIVVLSPGVDPHQACFVNYRQQGGVLIGDIELFAWFNTTALIGITGSNGKTTVTDMLGKVLTSAGLHVELAGNYGKCAVDILLENEARKQPLDFIVLELSSYQLEMTESLQLEYATVLNITEDHLDRHGSFEAYKLAKQRIFAMAKNIVACRDEALSYPDGLGPSNALSSAILTGVANTSIKTVSTASRSTHDTGHDRVTRICAEVSATEYDSGYSIAHAGTVKASIQFNGANVLNLSALQLKGEHNVINAMIVLAICDQLSLVRSLTIPAISAYKGLPHRFELIHKSQFEHQGKVSKVAWINDSKATNIGACQAALACFSHSDDYLILIAGGDAKGVELLPLKASIDEYVDQLIVLGKDAAKFSQIIPNAIPVADLNEAVKTAQSLLKNSQAANATVLLSPACASIDMFANYQQRGDVFTRAVKVQVA